MVFTSYENFWISVHNSDYAMARSLVEREKNLPEQVMCQYCYMLLMGLGGSVNPRQVSNMLLPVVNLHSSELLRIYLGRSFFDQGLMREALDVFYLSPGQPSPQLLYWRGITELKIDNNSVTGIADLESAARQGDDFARRDLILFKLSRSHGLLQIVWLRLSLMWVKMAGVIKIVFTGLVRMLT